MVTDNLASLCEQQLVDCVMVDSACNGELTDSAFAFAEENATCTEASHSFAAKKGTRKVSNCTVDRRGNCHEIRRRAHRQWAGFNVDNNGTAIRAHHS